MAGSYPDVPGFRFEYDRDGSIVIWDTTHTASTTAMQQFNDEDGVGLLTGANPISCQTYIGMAWPEHRDVVGLYSASAPGVSHPGDNWQVLSSTDTTNGIDGTWAYLMDLTMNATAATVVTVDSRTLIVPVTAAGGVGTRGLQFYPYIYRGGSLSYCIHVYGNYSLTENPDRLVLCDAAGTVVTNGAFFDFGNAPRNTQATKTFRIRNNSATKTAVSISVSFETLWDASPTLAGQFDYSFDGGSTWVASSNIGNLAPGAISAVIQMRRDTALGAQGGPWQSRVVAVPAYMA